jgi:hypothetical protein
MHCFLLALSSPSTPGASKDVSLLLVEFFATALPDAQCEWPIVTMLLEAVQSGAPVLLHPWLLEIGVQPSESSARLQQAFLGLFIVCSRPGPWNFPLFLWILVQGIIPPLRPRHTSGPTRVSASVDQLML